MHVINLIATGVEHRTNGFAFRLVMWVRCAHPYCVSVSCGAVTGWKRFLCVLFCLDFGVCTPLEFWSAIFRKKNKARENEGIPSFERLSFAQREAKQLVQKAQRYAPFPPGWQRTGKLMK